MTAGLATGLTTGITTSLTTGRTTSLTTGRTTSLTTGPSAATTRRPKPAPTKPGTPPVPRRATAPPPRADPPAERPERPMSRTAYPATEAPSVNRPQGTLYRSARRRPVPPVLRTVVTPPGPRLTALGSGLMAVGAMVLAGFAVQWTTGRAPVFYGVVFLLACFAAAGWVRPSDLVAAPVAMPLAFAAGLLAAADDPGGMGDKLIGVFTELALQAPWLYAGTLLATVVALVRKAALIAVRHLRRRSGAGSSRPKSRPADSERTSGKRTSSQRNNSQPPNPERKRPKSPERTTDRRPPQPPAIRPPRPPAPRPPRADPGGAPWEARR